jgi:hypothetical protein
MFVNYYFNASPCCCPISSNSPCSIERGTDWYIGIDRELGKIQVVVVVAGEVGSEVGVYNTLSGMRVHKMAACICWDMILMALLNKNLELRLTLNIWLFFWI